MALYCDVFLLGGGVQVLTMRGWEVLQDKMATVSGKMGSVTDKP